MATGTIVRPQPKARKVWRLDDFSKGLGPFEYVPGYYYWGRDIDTRRRGVVFGGPWNNIDLTGVAVNEKTVKAILVGADIWIITSTTAYRSVGGTANWTEVGANGVGWTAGNPTDIVAFQVSGGQPVIAVAMGASTTYQTTVDNGANWVASTKAGNAKYANYFTVASRAGTAPKVWYVRNNNDLYSTADLTNAGTSTTESVIGDYTNDEFYSVVEDDSGVLLIGKRRFLYTIDSLGNVRTINSRPYRYKAASDLGSFTGYPTRPGNQNFENPVIIEGRVYYVVEEYRIIEYDHGTLTENIQPSSFGAALLLQLPIVAMTRVGRELWVSLADAATTLLDATRVPGLSGMIGNTAAGAATSYIYAGIRNGDGSWNWHGDLISEGKIHRYLWYNDSSGVLFTCHAAQQTVNNSQTRWDVPVPDGMARARGSGFSLNSVMRIETGRFHGDLKRLIRGLGRMSADTTNHLRVDYRLAAEDETAGYTALDKYTTAYRAEKGTRFPPGTTCRGLSLYFIQVGAGATQVIEPMLYHYEVEYEG